MKAQSCFRITYGEKNGRSIASNLRIESQSLKVAMEDSGYVFDTLGLGENKYYSCLIEEPEGSEKLELLISLLKANGLQRCHHMILPRVLCKTHFVVRYIRRFTKKDLDTAEYLRINVKGSQCIADWQETTEEGYKLQRNTRLKNALDFGWLDHIAVPYVSDAGRRQLESESLSGVLFKSALFDEPEKVSKKLFELTSSVIMPSCLLSIQNSYGDIVDNHYKEGERIWNDKGYTQPILKYNRSEVETMGAFDIAKTKEFIGGGKSHYKHQYIISQKFRQSLEKMKVKGVEYVPVELVD